MGGLVWLVLLAVLLVCGVGAPIARSAFTGRSQNSRPDLQRVLDGLVSGWSRITPGVTAYVVGPQGVWSGSAGIAAPGVPMAPNARLRLNSVGKMWTATLILKLVGEHKLGLDDTVAHWLPGLLPYGNRITVRQLLRMTSGMINTDDITARPLYYIDQIKDPALRARVLAAGRRARIDPTYPPTQVWIQIAAAVPLLFPPDTHWHYSNIGYMVVGLIAERAGGADLATLFRRQIIDPLHLASARYDPAPNITGAHAHGYVINSNGYYASQLAQDSTGQTMMNTMQRLYCAG
jgi:D-alanyl-D-alanine carboxypeptidase